MNITICKKQYSLEDKIDNLLSVLDHLKQTVHPSLSYRHGCRSGVCGSCAVRVNGVETLACKTKIEENMQIDPLKNLPVIKDLIVDLTNQNSYLTKAHASLQEKSSQSINTEDEKRIDTESNCILCNSCFSSCPVYEVNQKFIGPYALLRNFRYVNDKKENEINQKIESVQTNGIWDCTLCGNCDMVCPEHIPIKNSINQLRNKSASLGYNNPYMQTFDSGFNTDFGFDPNSF